MMRPAGFLALMAACSVGSVAGFELEEAVGSVVVSVAGSELELAGFASVGSVAAAEVAVHSAVADFAFVLPRGSSMHLALQDPPHHPYLSLMAY